MEKTVFVRTKGWYMKELTNDLPLGRAEHYFTPYRQGRITSARRIDGAVRVTRHILICSKCGGCMPAYNRGGSKGRAFNIVELNEWLLGQCSFLGNDQEYDFNKPICVSDVQDLKCGSCGEYLGGPGRTEEYRINVSGAKLRISRRMSLAELISVGIAGRRELMAFAFTESVVFNKRKGHAYYEITDQSGQRLRQYRTTIVRKMRSQIFRQIA